jgi:hypothetical protein
MLPNAGPSLSRTVMVKLAVALLPESSEALHFTVVAPNGKMLPDEGSQLGVTLPSTASVAETEKETLVPAVLEASALIAFGTEIDGGFVSSTVILKLSLELFPESSVAVHFTVVEPSLNIAPEAGVHTGITLPSMASDAVALNVTFAPDGPVASAVMSLGTVTTGGFVSLTVTVNVPRPVLPASSVALHVTVVFPTLKPLPEAGVHEAVSLPLTLSEAVAPE